MTEEFDAAMHALIKESSVKLFDEIYKLVKEHEIDAKKLLLISPCMASYTVRLKSKIVLYHDGLEMAPEKLAKYIIGSLDITKRAEERDAIFFKKMGLTD